MTAMSASREAPIFPELRAIVEKTAGTPDVLRASLAQLVSKGRIRLAFVYGSVAAGQQTARSDIDLFIIGDASLQEIVPQLERADKRLGREINATVYPATEFRQKLKRGAPFLKRIVAGAKLFVVGDERELARLAR